MKRLSIMIVVLLLVQVFAVSALSASDAKQDWLDAKEKTKEVKDEHNDAKLAFAGDKSEENRQEVVDTGKVFLHAVLDEVEAWLEWKDIEAQENPNVPDHIKDSIKDDVDRNIDKINDLRGDVDGVTNQVELGFIFLKMVGKYFELVADVARNSGNVWVYVGNERADKVDEFEEKLREEAEDMYNNEDIMEKLDTAKAELETARRNLDNAETTYALVKIPGTPLIKFAEANNYLRAAKANLLAAHRNLNQAFILMVR